MLGELLSDVRYALRGLSSRPGIIAVAIATLAIGSGAATTTFAVVDSILLEPLAYPEADQVVAIWHDAPGAEFPLEDGGLLASASMLATYAEQNRVFESIGLWTPGVATVTRDGEPEEVPRIGATIGVLETLGVRPLLGRWFVADDVRGVPQVLLSYGYWQRRFGGDARVVGRTMTVNAQTAEIIGVMPAGFRIADTDADLLVGPMFFDRANLVSNSFAYLGVARLKPGVTVADANADLARMLPIWQESWPPPRGAAARVYTDVWHITPAVRPLKQDVVGDVGTLLWLVMAAIGVVLLIACANVANLMLIRGAARQHELAIRAVLGAGVARLRRVSLLEGLAIGLLGGVAALAIAAAALRVLLALAPPTLPRLHEVALDTQVMVLALAVTSVAGLLVGLVVAARVDGRRLHEGLHAGGRTSSQGRAQQRVQRSLVVAQVALAVVVLVCAGLTLRTAAALRAVEPGFSAPEHVQTLRISMRANQVPDPERVARRQQEIVAALAALPGVTTVGFGGSMPMDEFNRLGDTIEVESRPGEPSVRRTKSASPGFFGAVGISLKAGRDFSWTDLYEGRPGVLVSESMARELWTTPAAALGKRLRVAGQDDWREVIGVVADVREDGLRAPSPTTVYWPTFQPAPSGVSRSVVFAVRSDRAGTADFNREIQQAVWSVDPNLPLIWVRTLADIYDESLARTTFTLVTLVVAASAALALGVVGLYSVLSYAVALRRREIAIRLALGARQRDVRGQFVSNGVALAALGVAVGLAAAAGITRLMASLLYEVEPVDPLTYAAVAVALVGVAALASYVPARRASTVDPAESLAAE
jgi:putative ABC transport system permease protein